ncbi:TetR/AcrR family transcriptional regulator [Lactiplantibacillus plantarum]|uniref:TetR/AcrR family transcriptional regulator n=1 Tax=Lactiplantibacillus plantarum TaxID=1590 RepID=UPI00062A558D|nr:TetR/AcrR family transcriptional regulator [Lactiplantibacillus plantarum]ATL80166.1 TetR/AcrR family transcriptional regulator [Lactiplantibacillus plantarum]KKX43483.1 transcriptional regulator [Lactiplantibacillus plantarum]MCG0570060.1 transcriptional regulator [Lactiplantibacillus plantarum]MCG0616425.1 transcriptional regulator [Lactiplantibacillus plantarum]MZU28011.1 TetR/AcrR family transcriptional regulator [Lactiplantibacillus plantarum]
MKNSNRIDRRTIYTVNVIKDSFLELIQDKPYLKISIKEICKVADISRSTFYLHFKSINDVLNAILDDAIKMTPPDYLKISNFSIDYLKENESLIPACQRVGSSEKYRKLLLDPELTEYIVGRIMIRERNRVVPAIQEKTGLSKEDAETLFLYTLHGSFAVNRANQFRKNNKWYHDVQLINNFTLNGYNALN